MKAVIIAMTSILLSVGVCSYAEDERKEIPIENAIEALCGTWINPGGPGSDKDIYYPDGRFELYNIVESSVPYVKEKYKILNTWIDREANIWIFAERTFSYSKYALYKIGSSGTVIEIEPLFNNENLDEIDIEKVNFRYKMHRQ